MALESLVGTSLFQLRVNAFRPPSSEGEIHFDLRGRQRDGLIVEALRDGKRCWVGVFGFGETKFDFVSFVGNSTATVVAHGQAYWLNALEPEKWSTTTSPYLDGAVSVESCSCNVAYDDWGVYVVSASGDILEHQLDADGIHDLRVDGHFVVGTYEAVSKGGALVPFSISLEGDDKGSLSAGT